MNAIQALSQLSYSPETVIISVSGHPLSRRTGILYNPHRFELHLCMGFIIRLLMLTILAGIIFIGVALFRGGSDIRHAGDVIARTFDSAADKADRIRHIVTKTDSTIERVGDTINDAAHGAAERLKDTKDKIDGKASELKCRADDKADELRRIKDCVNNSISNSVDSFNKGKDRHATATGDKR